MPRGRREVGARGAGGLACPGRAAGRSAEAPPRLVELAARSLLRNQAVAVAALGELPAELFPPLFLAAYAGRRLEALAALVRAWPFACLPLGALMRQQWPSRDPDTVRAVLSGLDMLCAQRVRPGQWRLRVLDLRENAHPNFWAVWSGISDYTLPWTEPEAARPVKKPRVDGLGQGPVQVLMDLRLGQGRRDALLTCVVEKVRQRKDGLLRLCCGKLTIFAMPVENIKMTLDMVQLDSVQDLEMKGPWKLPVLGDFAPLLGQMVGLRTLHLPRVHGPFYPYPEKREQCLNQLASQFLRLHCLQELYLESVPCLRGHVIKVLRCLKSHLGTLSITKGVLSESDLVHLSKCPCITQLKNLRLCGVNLTSVSPEPLRVLLERTSSTLEDLDLEDCGITDSQLTAILPALSRCSQLTTFSFCGNPISMAVLQSLVVHTVGLHRLRHVLSPAPLESYEGDRGTFLLERLVPLHNKLKQMLCDTGRQGMIWLSASSCPLCGGSIFYDPEPLMNSHYLPA